MQSKVLILLHFNPIITAGTGVSLGQHLSITAAKGGSGKKKVKALMDDKKQDFPAIVELLFKRKEKNPYLSAIWL